MVQLSASDTGEPEVGPVELCDDEALRLGPREEGAGGILPTQGRWCAHTGRPQCTGEQGWGDAPRTPEGLMVEGTTKVTLKVLGEEGRGWQAREKWEQRCRAEGEAGVSGAS